MCEEVVAEESKVCTWATGRIEVPATEMGSPADRGGLSGNDEEFSFRCVRFEVSKILAEILSSTRVWSWRETSDWIHNIWDVWMTHRALRWNETTEAWRPQDWARRRASSWGLADWTCWRRLDGVWCPQGQVSWPGFTSKAEPETGSFFLGR